MAALNDRYRVSPTDLAGVGKWAATTLAFFFAASFANYRARAYAVLGAKRAAKLAQHRNACRKLLERHKDLYKEYFESFAAVGNDS